MVDDNRANKKLTPELIESKIVSVHYETVEKDSLYKFMYCYMVMDNGFVAIGDPATCIDPSKWSDEIGKDVSYSNTYQSLWQLETYRLLSENI